MALWGIGQILSPEYNHDARKIDRHHHPVLRKSTKGLQHSEKCLCLKNHWTSWRKTENPESGSFPPTSPQLKWGKPDDRQWPLCHHGRASPSLGRWATQTLSKGWAESHGLRQPRLQLCSGTARSCRKFCTWAVETTALHTILVNRRSECIGDSKGLAAVKTHGGLETAWPIRGPPTPKHIQLQGVETSLVGGVRTQLVQFTDQ